MNLYFWSFTLCCITAFILLLILLYQSVVSFISWLKEKNYIYAIKILGVVLIIVAIILIEGYFYYQYAIRNMHCPNCNYEYKMMYRTDNCPQCNFELNGRNVEITDKEKEK